MDSDKFWWLIDICLTQEQDISYTSLNSGDIFSSNLFESKLIPKIILLLYVDMSESHENSQENIHPALRKCRFVFLEDFGPLFTLPHWFWMVENQISIFFNNTPFDTNDCFPFPEFYLLWASISLISSLVPCTWFFVTIDHSTYTCIRIKLHQVHLYKTSISLMFNNNVYNAL